MTIKEYIEWMNKKGEDINFSTIAEKIPCSPTYISKIANGKVNPGYRMAARIEQITDGMVTKANWYK